MNDGINIRLRSAAYVRWDVGIGALRRLLIVCVGDRCVEVIVGRAPEMVA